MRLVDVTDDEIWKLAVSYLPQGVDIELGYEDYKSGEIEGAVIGLLSSGIVAGVDVRPLGSFLLDLWRSGDTHDIVKEILDLHHIEL